MIIDNIISIYFQRKYIPFIFMEWRHVGINNFGLCPHIEKLLEVNFLLELSHMLLIQIFKMKISEDASKSL